MEAFQILISSCKMRIITHRAEEMSSQPVGWGTSLLTQPSAMVILDATKPGIGKAILKKCPASTVLYSSHASP